MKLSSRDRRAVLLGALGLAILLAGHYLLLPWMDSWRESRRQIEESRMQLHDMRRDINRVLGQRRRLEEIYGPAINAPLQDLQTARMNLLKDAQSVFKAGGFAASNYQPQRARPLAKVPGVQIVPLQVRGKCKFPQLTNCLAAMSGAETLLIVDSFSLSNDEKKPGELEVSIMVSTLARMDEAGL